MISSGLDLNYALSICNPARNLLVGGIDEPGQTGFRASHAALAADNVSSLRGALRWRAQGQDLLLPRPISLDGVRAIDLSREFARYRSVPESPRKKALPHGYQEPGIAQHTGRCQRESRLAHLRRLCPVAHGDRPPSLCRGTFWSRFERDGLRPRCQYHRPVPVGVLLGAVSLDQSGHQAAHALGSARQYSLVPAHQRWQTARRQRFGPGAAGARRLLRYGPRIYRFRAASLPARSGQLLCDARQVQSQSPAPLFALRRSQHGIDLRSDHRTYRLLLAPRLRHTTAPHPIQRPRDRQTTGLPDQQLCPLGNHYHRALSMSVAGRVVFQMDQATSSYQILLRYLRECGQDSSVDRSLGLPAGGHRQKAT